MPKTGSTWLQHEILPKMKSIDVCYKEELRKCMLHWSNKNILISYENYVGFPHIKEADVQQGWIDSRKRSLCNLSSFFPDSDIILIVRKQTELLKSLYNQYIKVGGSISFHEYISGEHPYSININALKYIELLNQIQQKFSGSVLIVDYNFMKSHVEEFGKVFLSFVGCNDLIDFNKHSGRKVNTSLSNAQIKNMLRFNRQFHTYYSPNGYKMFRRKTYKKIRTIILRLTDFAYGNKQYDIFHKDDIEKLENFYDDDWRDTQQITKGRFKIINNKIY